ncbi:MAG: HNH endonuclease [Nitrospirae bacterium]|nr:HNH endonuclease [Nitrospirota bacterium]
MPQDYPKDFIELCKSVTAKRAKTVIDHILMYGHISTEELKNKYGYNHPPRAVRDVREHGISIETFRITGSDGRKIAAYRFSDVTKQRFGKLSGRTGLSKKIKKYLINKFGSKCFIYLEEISDVELQIDHRIPFEVGRDGENVELNPDDFMLLSASANRAKSWSCEHCENWQTLKKRDICLSCYWAYPQDYAHIAMQQVRRVDLIWQNKEIEQYERLKTNASVSSQTIPEFIKEIIRKALEVKKSN